MASVGEVIYHRGQGNEADIWDDSALIKAYDEAVSVMKAKLAAEQGDDEQSTAQETQQQGKHKKNKKKHRNRNKKDRQRKVTTTTWSEGDLCRAVFADDGLIYDGILVSVDDQAGTCVVRYTGYGNEEVHNIADLQPPAEPRDSQADEASDGGSSMDWRHSPRPPSVASTRSSGMGRGHPRHPRPPSSHFMPPPPSFPFAPPIFPGMPSFPAWPGLPSFPAGLPQVPPPPPLPEDIPENDSEALHSMLIAWYMSGYHTGYYQGLRNAKKKAPDSPSSQKSKDTHRK